VIVFRYNCMTMKSRSAMLTTSLLLLLIADVAVRLSSAGNTLCINADNFIDQLFINGADVTSQLVNARAVRGCDCIQLPANTKTIAVKASNLGRDAGLQACRTASAPVYDGWRCVDTKKVAGSSWYSVNYNDKWWKPARVYHWPKKHLCKHWGYLPCQMGRYWFWAKKPLPSVVCRTEFCQDGCTGCQSAGPGQCDPGHCAFGSGTSNGTTLLVSGKSICQRQCTLDVKAWAPGSPADGYIRLTDASTGAVDTWTANQAGRYLATLDMATCTVVRQNYTVVADLATLTTVLNTFNDPVLSPGYHRVIAVDILVGGGHYVPWIDVWVLGIGEVNSLYGSTNHSTSFHALLQGVENGDVTFTNVVGPF